MRVDRLIRLLMVACIGSNCGLAHAAPAMDQAAPPLVGTGLNGQVIDLAKLHGKVVLVNYWATWCAPCRKVIPVLDAFHRRYRDRGLEVIGISVDFARDTEKMRKAAALLSYPTVMQSEIAVDGFGPPEGAPLTYVIDVDGVLRDKFIAIPPKLLNDVVLPLLPR